MERPTPVSVRYFSQDERLLIADLLRAGLSIRAISRELGRHASSVSREVRLGTNPASGLYEPYRAHQQAHLRPKRPKTVKILENPVLFALIEKWLGKHWSPEQISDRLKQMYHHDESIHLCTETIYQAIYVHTKGTLKLDLKKALRHGQAVRKPHTSSNEHTPRFRKPMMIHDRPASANDRAIPGHWEGDLILRIGNKSPIGTLAERSTRFTILLHLPHRHDSHAVQEAIIHKMHHLPAVLRNTLTWDQDSKMAPLPHLNSPGHTGLLLRPTPPLAARKQRKTTPHRQAARHSPKNYGLKITL